MLHWHTCTHAHTTFCTYQLRWRTFYFKTVWLIRVGVGGGGASTVRPNWSSISTWRKPTPHPLLDTMITEPKTENKRSDSPEPWWCQKVRMLIQLVLETIQQYEEERGSWGEMEEKALSNEFRGERLHSSLLSWALANDNNSSSSLFLDNEPQQLFGQMERGLYAQYAAFYR